ncbi:MAG TPA: DEAD/DEAH box helicase, partial [Ktedonobacteraceae bacterium]|nr:DEAD/DEAH box helicase [Ktedonobacteraceae bacterium]
MDEYVVAEQEGLKDIQEFASQYSFPLDDFQIEAMMQLAQEQSVMVAAPTGTGKTLVAEYAVWRALKAGQRVIYTTPLKALSNQKYRDLRELYGVDVVGLVTGDIVEHSRASVVVMTTEVYRNMLLEEGSDRFVEGESVTLSALADVGFIVFDELHYLSDIGRGPVWEEAIICSPPHIQLVGLSATMSNAEDIANWISRVHRPISLVVHEERAVPLDHYYLLDEKLHLVQDADGKRIETFPNVGGEARLSRYSSYRDGEEDEGDDRRGRRGQREEDREGEETSQAARNGEEPKPAKPKRRKAPEPGEVLSSLQDEDLLPCLYFLPGRKVVEEAASSAARHLFASPEEQELIREEVRAWLENLSPDDRKLRQVNTMINMLPRGIGFHHAGLIPGLKVLVEALFARGHLRAVFATDTLALGINMPARAVVVGSLSKFDGQEMRLLTPNEYRQLTGRAGRRGLDVHGAAVIPYSPWEPFENSFQRITGELLPVTSSFMIRYNSVLNLWRPGEVDHLRRICASSLREYQRYLLWEMRELARLEKLEQKYHTGKKISKKRTKSREGAMESLERRRKKIGDFPLSRAGAAELDGTIFALRALGYIAQDDQLSIKGRLLKGMFHPAGVMIVELMMQGAFESLSPGELAEVISWFTFDHDRRLNNKFILPANLQNVRRELWRVMQHVHGIEERANIAFSPGIVPDFFGVALSWSRGMTLSGLLQRIDLAEGDLLMILNQTIDLIQQVQSAVGQLVDSRDLKEQASPTLTDGVMDERNSEASARNRQNKLQVQYDRLTRMRPALAQAAGELFHGIISQTRSVPSMVAEVKGEE